MKMVSPSSSLQLFSSSSSLSLVKFKTLIQTLILSLARAISRGKSKLLHILRHPKNYHQYYSAAIANNFKRSKNKILFGSFRLHYNWCSSSNSHVTPAPEDYYGSEHGDDGLCGYLEWLEKKQEKGNFDQVNEIDKLAEIFIASCHEKFRLEKQESYRRFQEMIARSL